MSKGTIVAVIGSALVVAAGLAFGIARLLAPAAPEPAPVPVVTSVVPATGFTDAPARGVTVYGTGIAAGARVALVRPGQPDITGTDFAFIDGALVGGTFALTGAETGAWSVQVINPDGQRAACAGCYAVSAPGEPPLPRALSVAEVRQGATLAATLTGARFQAGASVAISGSGIRVEDVRVVSTTTIELRIVADASAPLETRSVTLTNPDRKSGTCADCLRVSPGPPSPSAAAPSTFGAGAQGRAVSITGGGFRAGATLSFTHPGIKAGSIVVSDTGIGASLSVATSTPGGSYDIVVTNKDGQKGTCSSCLAIVEGPVASRVAPASALPGETLDILISGSGFQQGTAIAFSGAGITLGSPAYVSASQMTVSLSIASSAPATARILTLTNPDGGTATLLKAFTVATSTPPATPGTMVMSTASSTR